jgi:hypothetical protein
MTIAAELGKTLMELDETMSFHEEALWVARLRKRKRG